MHTSMNIKHIICAESSPNKSGAVEQRSTALWWHSCVVIHSTSWLCHIHTHMRARTHRRVRQVRTRQELGQLGRGNNINVQLLYLMVVRLLISCAPNFFFFLIGSNSYIISYVYSRLWTKHNYRRLFNKYRMTFRGACMHNSSRWAARAHAKGLQSARLAECAQPE